MPSYEVIESCYYIEKRAKKILFTVYLKLKTNHRVKVKLNCYEKDLAKTIVFPTEIVTEKINLNLPTEETLQLRYGDYTFTH